MAVYGYKPSGSAPDYGFNADNVENYMAYVPDAPTENGWAYSMGCRVGPRVAGDYPDCKLVMLDTDPNPDDVRVTTVEFTPTTTMLDGAGGAVHEVALESSARLFNGSANALAIQAIGAALGFGMIQASALPGKDNYLFYYKTDTSFPPASPMAYTRTSYEGHLAIWVNYEPNVAPDVPGSLAPIGLQPTFTPTFTGTFRDDNEAIPGFAIGSADQLASFDLEVRRSSDNVLMWSLSDEPATSSEKTARAFSRVYSGTALSSGVTYKWRARVADRFSAKSSYTAWQEFTVGSGSLSASTPSGKQETRTPGPFVATWTHSGALSATRARVVIRDADTQAIVRQIASSGYVTLGAPVASGNNISVAWADLGFTDLPWGGDYTWEMTAYDGSSWSAASNRVVFSTNTAPTIPTNLSPANSEATSSYPNLTCVCVDEDDTVATGFVVKAVITNEDTSTVIGTYAMTLKSGTTDTWELQTSVTHLAGYATYSFQCYGGDGTLWSGEQTVEGSAIKSAKAIFEYAAGPTVTVTSPTADQVLTSSTPTITWTAANQATYRVVIHTDTGEDVLDTGVVISSDQSYAVPANFLEDNGSYRVRVYVVDTLVLSGSSAWTYFTVDYVEPGVISGFAASPEYASGDTEPTVVLLTWNQADPGGNTFLYYNITREPTDTTPIDVDDYGRDSRKIRVARITDINTTSFEDHTAASGITYIYRIRQFVQNGADTMNSLLSTVQIRLTFEHAVLQQVPEGSYIPEHRIVLPYRGNDFRVVPVNDTTFWRPMGKKKPLAFKGEAFNRQLSGQYRLYTEDLEELRSMERELLYMFAQNLPLLWRDSRRNRVFCEITAMPIVYPPAGGTAYVELSLQEVDMSEIYE